MCAQVIENLSFDAFLQLEVQKSQHRDLFESYVDFRKSRLSSPALFSKWLELNACSNPSLEWIKELVKTYIELAFWQIKDSPRLLSIIERHYKITLPDEEGILTVEYWANAMTNNNNRARKRKR